MSNFKDLTIEERHELMTWQPVGEIKSPKVKGMVLRMKILAMMLNGELSWDTGAKLRSVPNDVLLDAWDKVEEDETRSGLLDSTE